MGLPKAGRRSLRAEPLEERAVPGAGDLDPTFGIGGRAILQTSTDTFRKGDIKAVAVLPSGSILVAGEDRRAANPQEMMVARLTPDGVLDGSALVRPGRHRGAAEEYGKSRRERRGTTDHVRHRWK